MEWRSSELVVTNRQQQTLLPAEKTPLRTYISRASQGIPAMNRCSCWLGASLVAGLSVWLGMAMEVNGAEPGGWRASSAKVSITPDQPVWMAGYASRNGPSEGVLTELFVRAVAIQDERANRLVFVGLDLIEIPESLRDAIVELVGKQHGLQPHELLLNVSHTHGGPMVSSKTVADWGIDAAWGLRAERYVATLVSNVSRAVGESLSTLKEANVSYGHARCGFAMNRRLPTPGGFRLAPNADGPVDHDVPVLRVDSKDSHLIGLIFGYACHNTALGDTRQLHGDYAGFAQKKLEQDHPDSVALFLAGCGGDQDPSPRRHLEDAQQNGLALASAVEGALAAGPRPLNATLNASLEHVPLAFSPLPSREELNARSQSGDGFVARHARMILAKWPKPGDQPDDYRYPVQVAVLGQSLTLVALAGEPTVDYAIRLKSELVKDGRQVWVAGYSNLVNAYIPSRRVLQEGGYEGTQAVIYQSLPTPFRPELEDQIIGSVHRQADSLFRKPNR